MQLHFELLVIVGICVTGAFGQANGNPPQLTFTTIDVPGAGFSYVSGINNLGDMVGTYGQNNNGFEGHGFLLRGGVFSYFDFPQAEITYTGGINDSGLIAGTVIGTGIGELGYLYDGQTFTTFGMRSREQEVVAYGINNNGTVVGAIGYFGGYSHAYEMTDNSFTRVPLPISASFKEAVGINNLGQIAAIAINGIDRYAFIYMNRQAKQINFPHTVAFTDVSGINDYGIVAGSYFELGTGEFGFAFKDGKFLRFAVPGAIDTYTSAINNLGQIVGEYITPDSAEHGFVTSPITPADFQPANCCVVDPNWK